MFMEVISGNHGSFGHLPSNSPIKNGYIYQQIKGPSAGPLSSSILATKSNSSWLWGVKSNGSIVVAGKIESREVEVKIDAGADFVFEKNYPIKSIEEVEAFIKENKHLPEIPSASEMEENGIELGEMNIKLLQKIEELTLYVIEQNKEMKEVKERMNKVEAENEELRKAEAKSKEEVGELKELSAKLLELEKKISKLESNK